jgi:glycosyltransferase involved in cell wall biosynthesis
MALGRPVISTYIAGIPELVRHGVDGWLVPAGDLDATVAAMRACLDTPPERLQRMGVEAQARVRERHHVDVEAAKLRTLFETAHEEARA